MGFLDYVNKMVGPRHRIDLTRFNRTINNYIGNLRHARSSCDETPTNRNDTQTSTEDVRQLLKEICDLSSFGNDVISITPSVANRRHLKRKYTKESKISSKRSKSCLILSGTEDS